MSLLMGLMVIFKRRPHYVKTIWEVFSLQWRLISDFTLTVTMLKHLYYLQMGFLQIPFTNWYICDRNKVSHLRLYTEIYLGSSFIIPVYMEALRIIAFKNSIFMDGKRADPVEYKINQSVRKQFTVQYSKRIHMVNMDMLLFIFKIIYVLLDF